MAKYDPIKAGIMELLGCFALAFFGSFTATLPENPEEQNSFFLENALAHIFIYMVMMWLAAQHSGSQFNPMVTAAAYVSGELPATIAVINVAAQLAGAFFGFFALQTLGDANVTYLNYKETPVTSAFIFEALPSFMLTLAYLMTFVHKTSDRGVYAVAVPAVYAVFLLSVGKIYYTRYNLLLLLVTATLSTGFSLSMLYVAAGNILGAALAIALYVFAFKKQARKEKQMPLMEEDNQIKF